jgi:hypothetical protein
MPINVARPNIEPTTETKKGLQEFLVRIKYPVPGSAEHVIDVIGDSGTSTEANVMNIISEINDNPAYPPIREGPPPYSLYGGNKRNKHKKTTGLFTAVEFIKF